MEVKHLGVILNSSLSFNAQIKRVVKVYGSHLRNITFVKEYSSEQTFKKILILNQVIGKLLQLPLLWLAKISVKLVAT